MLVFEVQYINPLKPSQSQSQSQSHFTTDDQSSPFWGT
jgi:hypothetical protein